METTLHRQLKERFGPEAGGRAEVVVAGFRIDAVGPDGWLVEVQSGALAPLRRKLARLLAAHRVRVVKPVAVGRRIVRRARAVGPDLAARRSPKRGATFDAFDDLIGLARLFPHPHLEIDVLAVEVEEVRIPRRRRPGYAVADRRLARIVGTTTLREAGDLWALLPIALPARFTTADLAARLDRSEDFARRVAYCLRLSGAAESVGKAGNRLVYARPDRPGATAGPGQGRPPSSRCRAR